VKSLRNAKEIKYKIANKIAIIIKANPETARSQAKAIELLIGNPL
jgi:hypothetical protein